MSDTDLHFLVGLTRLDLSNIGKPYLIDLGFLDLTVLEHAFSEKIILLPTVILTGRCNFFKLFNSLNLKFFLEKLSIPKNLGHAVCMFFQIETFKLIKHT